MSKSLSASSAEPEVPPSICRHIEKLTALANPERPEWDDTRLEGVQVLARSLVSCSLGHLEQLATAPGQATEDSRREILGQTRRAVQTALNALPGHSRERKIVERLLEELPPEQDSEETI